MSAWEEVPTEHEISTYFTPDEFVEYMEEVYEDLRIWNWTRRHYHDTDARLMLNAGSLECLEHGHEPHPVHEWEDDYHIYGWNGEFLCPDTIYADACSYCESSECEYTEKHDYDLWKLVAA